MGKIVQKTLLSCKRYHMTDAELNTNTSFIFLNFPIIRDPKLKFEA